MATDLHVRHLRKIMPSSESRKLFESNFTEIDHLIDIHEALVSLEREDDDGEICDFTDQKSVLIKSSIVLMVSYWETYVEDICSEAIKHMVTNLNDSNKLPKELKQQISKEILSNKNELKMWELCGDNWKTILSNRLNDYSNRRNWKFNSPKSNQVVNFFKEYLGIADISKKWVHKKLTSKECMVKLDEIVEVRGTIAHRGHPPRKITLTLAKNYANFLKSIISKTGGSVNAHVKKTCGSGLF